MIIGILMLLGVWLLGIVLVDLTIKIDELQKKYNKLVKYTELTKENEINNLKMEKEILLKEIEELKQQIVNKGSRKKYE